MNCRGNRREGYSMMLCFRRKILVFLLINSCLLESRDMALFIMDRRMLGR